MNARSTRIRENLTRRERQAPKKLQRPTDVIIKPADKGSGTVVVDRQNYLDECYRQLNNQHFYNKATDDINKRVRFLAQRLLADDVIDKETYNYLLPQNPKSGHFYILPKIHKAGNRGRPIVSANGHPTERMSEFVSYHLNPLIQLLPAYVKNTTHLLNILEGNRRSRDRHLKWKGKGVLGARETRGPGCARRVRVSVSLAPKTPFPFPSNACHAGYVLPTNAMLVTLDVSSLYTNIPINELKESTHAD